MTTLEEFRSTLPIWRVAVEEWLDRQPAWFRNDPAWASSVYLLGAPPLVALESMALKSVEEGWIRWDEILTRAEAAGEVEAALAAAAYELAKCDPGPALGLMLVLPRLTVLRWAHAAGVLYQIVEARARYHPLAV
ncbi:MAG: hypothetical protein M3450_04450 [Actinomycetota bacterium]|nr:hypothetical protein [Actinomycetota bacterium]MDQ3640725.1 hypothetical protein [Actinomycetota bacterium]